ncbi:MAG: hypothetical protein NUV57_05770 [archaeon]|nr:hypothetical protein [archaeon]
MPHSRIRVKTRQFSDSNLHDVQKNLAWEITNPSGSTYLTYKRHPKAENMVRHNFDRLTRPEIHVRYRKPRKKGNLEVAATIYATSGKKTRQIHLCVPRGTVMGEKPKPK